MEEALAWLAANWLNTLGYVLWAAAELIRKNPKLKSNSLIELGMNLASLLHNWGEKEKNEGKEDKENNKSDEDSDNEPEEVPTTDSK